MERPAVEGEIPFIIYDAECAAAMTGKSVAELERAMHLVRPDSTVFEGANAVREILRYTAWGWLPRALFRLPGAMLLADRVYAWVALRRQRIGCGGEHCIAVDSPEKKQ